MRRILIVEDDNFMSNLIQTSVEEAGFQSEIFEEGSKVLTELENNPDKYDLIILDILLGKSNGLEICENIRKKNLDVPLIIISQKDQATDKVKGLNAGADDYLAKPFDKNEMIARINSVLKRYQMEPNATRNNKRIQLGSVSLDDDRKEVYVNDKKVEFTQTEYNILKMIMTNKDRVTKREDLLQDIWDVKGYDIVSNSIDVHINKLRKKLKDAGNESFIKTIRGFGYKVEIKNK